MVDTKAPIDRPIDLDLETLDYWLTEEQVYLITGFTPSTLQSWRSLGTGPAFVRIGRSVRYTRTVIRDWQRTCEKNSGATK